MTRRAAPLLLLWIFAMTAAARPWAGRPLAEALRDLQAEGLDVMFTSALVRPEMRVDAEPADAAPRIVLEELLRPHGLAVRELADGQLQVVKARGRTPARDDRPAAVTLDEIVVTSSFSLLSDEASSFALDREEIAAVPHFGDDLYRAVRVLPATSGGDISGRFNVRGGLHEEVLVRLDGLELFEPFHLQDLQGVFSILDPRVVGGVELLAGSYPAEYGDRMTAVLDMSTRRVEERRTSLGISFSNAWAGSAGTFAAGRGSWLASARRGYLDVVLSFVDDAEGDRVDEEKAPDPRYGDVFGKLAWEPGPRSSIALQALAAADSVDFTEDDSDELTTADTRYGNAYVWLRHQTVAGPRAFAETVASAGRLRRDREGSHVQRAEDFAVRDDRRLEVYGIRQDWSWQPSSRHYLKGGLEARRYEADYAYRNRLRIRFPIDDERFPPRLGTTAFDDRFASESYGAYAADRLRLGRRLTAELGLRYDRQGWTHDRQLSPRLNLVAELGAAGALRAGWGLFHQSLRPHELAVEYGETAFTAAERAEHRTLGYETRLGGLTFRAEAYRRTVDDPRVRYETLFDPFAPFPEARSDRVRIAPERVEARGLELYVKGRSGGRFDWWASYVLASVEDRLDGVDVPRSIDQRHALTLYAGFRPGRKWSLDAVWTYHTGWPATALAASAFREPDGTLAVVHAVGPFYAERHPGYHRLDLRASRAVDVRRGTLSFFLDVQNLYDRENVRGLAIDDEEIVFLPDGGLAVRYPVEKWLGIIPSFGVSWEL